jgi:hypothetical protein
MPNPVTNNSDEDGKHGCMPVEQVVVGDPGDGLVVQPLPGYRGFDELTRTEPMFQKGAQIGNEKTWGRIAYEAYCESMNWVGFWGDQADRIKQAWEHAARAVRLNG